MKTNVVTSWDAKCVPQDISSSGSTPEALLWDGEGEEFIGDPATVVA